MATGPQMLAALKQATQELPEGSDYWVDIAQKMDLCKLTVSNLTEAGYAENVAKNIVSALNHQDLLPLGNAVGHPLRVKFRTLADRVDACCRISCEREENAQWLNEYLRSQFQTLNATAIQSIADTPLYRFDVAFNNQATPYRLRKALIDCPAPILLRLYSLRIAEQPHYLVESSSLATWIDDQGEEQWWTVDGDPILTSRLGFPCPPDELTKEIRRVDKSLLVFDPFEIGTGEQITPDVLDNLLIDIDEMGHRKLLLCWQDGSVDWELVVDEPALAGM